MSLLVSLQSELLKTKRTPIWYLCIVAAVLAPIFSYTDSGSVYRMTALKNDPWNVHLIGMGPRIFNMMILPIFLILICTLTAQLEYRNNTWKQVYVSPQPLLKIFVSKYLLIQFMLLSVFIVTLFLLVLSLFTIDYFDTCLSLSQQKLDWNKFVRFWGRIYVSVLAISALQFWAGLRFKSFIFPIIIGISLLFAAAMMMEEGALTHDNKLPYIYPLRNCFPQRPSDSTYVTWGSLVYTVLFLKVAFVDFRTRQNKSQ